MVTAESNALHRADQGTVHFQTRPIKLRDGWSGRVVTGWEPAESPGSALSAVPTIDQWAETLGALVADGTTLPNQTILKQSPTALVFRARISAGSGVVEIVCKQSSARDPLRGFVQRFRASRERKTFERAFLLLRAGINTALPLAVLERTWPRKEAWLVAEAIPDTVGLERVVSGLLWELEPARMAGVKRALLEELVGLCRRMADHRLYHRDLKASNILVTDWDGVSAPPRMWLVDLDGVRKGRRHDPAAEWRAIMRLAASLVGYRGLGRTDCLRFLGAYPEAEKGSGPFCAKHPPGRSGKRVLTPFPLGWKDRWRQLARAIADYNRRSRRRKRGKIDGFTGE